MSRTQIQQRALLAVRLSVRTDETTSPERQETACRAAASYYGMSVAGVAEDLDVSATKTTPWERPDLGNWLNNRTHEFDAIIWWKLDRAVRSMTDMSELVKWARAEGKRLIFAEGPGGGSLELDLTGRSPIAELLMQVFAFAAQMEAVSISERVSGTAAAMSTMPYRWRGGTPPYGYRPAPNPDGPGKLLVRDADETAVLVEVIRRVLDGEAVSAIVVDLNTRGIMPRQRMQGAIWHPSALDTLLRSPALMGHKTHKRYGAAVSVRDSEGRPVMQTHDPILTPDEYEELQAELDKRRIVQAPRKDTNALLLRIIHCVSCGGRMYLEPGRSRTTVYRCKTYSTGVKCPAPVSIKDTDADAFAESEYLSRLGNVAFTDTVTHGGSDPRPEIERTANELELLAQTLSEATSEAARGVWQRRVDALSTRLAELEAQPVVEPWTEHVPTGTSVADEWHAADTAGKRGMLTDAQVKVWVHPKNTRPDDRLEFALESTDWVSAADAMDDAAFQATM